VSGSVSRIDAPDNCAASLSPTGGHHRLKGAADRVLPADRCSQVTIAHRPRPGSPPCGSGVDVMAGFRASGAINGFANEHAAVERRNRMTGIISCCMMTII
jgi:hypothetical protein